MRRSTVNYTGHTTTQSTTFLTYVYMYVPHQLILQALRRPHQLSWICAQCMYTYVHTCAHTVQCDTHTYLRTYTLRAHTYMLNIAVQFAVNSLVRRSQRDDSRSSQQTHREQGGPATHRVPSTAAMSLLLTRRHVPQLCIIPLRHSRSRTQRYWQYASPTTDSWQRVRKSPDFWVYN